MGTDRRDLAIIGIVEGAVILGAILIPKAAAKPKPPTGEAILQGLVTESEHLLPIPFATIDFDDLSCSADENGEYQIVDIPLGTYTLTVRADGYKPKTITVTIKEPQSYTLDISLEPVTPLVQRRLD